MCRRATRRRWSWPLTRYTGALSVCHRRVLGILSVSDRVSQNLGFDPLDCRPWAEHMRVGNRVAGANLGARGNREHALAKRLATRVISHRPRLPAARET